jgi:tRNA G18 (ribose-2'-O)-methylase SpoU
MLSTFRRSTRAPPRTALLLGAEGPELTPEAQAAARFGRDSRAPPRVDSLGAAAAAATSIARLR